MATLNPDDDIDWTRAVGLYWDYLEPCSFYSDLTFRSSGLISVICTVQRGEITMVEGENIELTLRYWEASCQQDIHLTYANQTRKGASILLFQTSFQVRVASHYKVTTAAWVLQKSELDLRYQKFRFHFLSSGHLQRTYPKISR